MSKEQTDLVAPLLALAQRNIPVDVQELLIAGNPDRGIPPGALAAAIAATAPPSPAGGVQGVTDNLVTELRGLIDAYWGIAYSEGREGRTTDTLDGAAQRTRTAIEARLSALSSQAQTTGGVVEMRAELAQLRAELVGSRGGDREDEEERVGIRERIAEIEAALLNGGSHD